MSQIKHNSGLHTIVSESGFDMVKYFEATVSGTAQSITIEDTSPPAKRLSVSNRGTSGNLFINITGDTATSSVSFTPGDNIKIEPGCSFTMDFDTLRTISFISDEAGGVAMSGLLGWKGSQGC